MKRYSIFIWLLILAGVASGTIPFVADVLIAKSYGGGEISKFVQAQIKAYAASIAFLENVISAIWLVFATKDTNANRIAWPLFGVVYGLWAIAIFYLLSIHDQLMQNQQTEPPN